MPHLSSTSRALYRVFVTPPLRTTAPGIPIHFAPAFAPHFGPPSTIITTPTHTQTRSKTFTRDTRRHALSDYFTLDAAITAPHINYVDATGTFHPNTPTATARASFDPTTHHLVLMVPGSAGNSPSDPADLPVCRVVSKADLRAQHERRVDLARKQAKGTTGPVQKNLELNWAIGGGDLKHRIGKLQEFLREGRRVEVLLGPKKKGRKATPEEAEAVYKGVVDAVKECVGAKEVKREGEVGAVLTLVFEGKKST